MSYLHLPRLTFSGDFISDVSTVNNDTQHYNNATFEPSFQLPSQGAGHANNGWWNPEGGATFGFQNCRITQATNEDGSVVNDPALDNIIGQIVAGADGRNSGKMVDLDPDNQMVSALWGVTFRILTAQNELLLEGKIKPTSFRDLQQRQTNGGQPNGQALGGTWTSVLEDVVWGPLADTSPFLIALRQKTQQNKISINLNAFGYYYTHTDGRFSLGRILGSIGPWFDNEPELFAPARRLYGVYQNGKVFGGSNFLVDQQHARLSIDLGSSFPVSDSMGTITYNSKLFLAVSSSPINFPPSANNYLIEENELTIIGQIPYATGPKPWLNTTSGIADFSDFTDEVVTALEKNQLVLVASNDSNQYLLIAREAIGGYVCRADNFVQRIDTNQKVTVDIYAYQFGNPLANQTISLTMEAITPDTPKNQNTPPISIVYGNNKPQDGLSFSSTCTTNSNGLAQIEITGNSINSPRHYIDGQIYWIDYDTVENSSNDPAIPGPYPTSITAHLRDDFAIPENPVWSDIAPTMIQFANLYPIMSRFFINFADPEALIAKKEILKFAFTRDIHDPIYMPVTRDLSENKRLTILKWLDNPLLDKNATKLAPPSTIEPTHDHVSLSAKHAAFKEATKAKNGNMLKFPELTNLFEF